MMELIFDPDGSTETSYERTTTTETYNVMHSVPPHSLVITQTGGSLGGMMTSWIDWRSTGGVLFNEGQYAVSTANNVSAVKESREKERKDMQNLNDRFSYYIEKVQSCI